MRNLLAFAMLALTWIAISANEVIDECVYRFVYRSSIKTAVEDTRPASDPYVLEIGKKVTKFYPPNFEEYMALKDSVMKVGITYDELLQIQMERGLLNVRQSMRILKDYPHRGKLTEIRNIGNDYMAVQNSPVQKWEMMPGDTVVAGYKCHRARTTFRGRTWYVCYTEEIPIHSGPWKLGGLPGLILHAKDDKGLFSFDCQEIQNGGSRNIDIVVKPGYRKCSLKELISLQNEWTTNSAGMMMQISGLSDESPYKATQRTPAPLEIPE